MGSFNESCGFSGLPITHNDKVRMMAIRYVGGVEGNMMTSPFKLFEPVSLLVRGQYNDYGWIDFEDGEEERFFTSVGSMGINLVKRERDFGVRAPANVFIWFMLEDAFQLADEMPVDCRTADGYKTIPIRETRAPAFVDWRALRVVESEHFAKVRAQTAEDDSYDRQFKAEEKAKRHLSTNHYNVRTSLMIAARRQVDDRALIDLFDLERLAHALDAIRRPLTPTMSGGQGYDDEPQKLLATFVAGRKDPYDED